jgi:hypothetical protein
VSVLSDLDITSVSAIIAAVGVIIGIAFTVLELRHIRRQRQTDLLINLSSKFDDKEFSKTYTRIVNTNFENLNDFIEKCTPEGLLIVGSFFNKIGTLLERGLIDQHLVYDLFFITGIWEKMKPWVLYMRQKYIKDAFESFEYLYDEMKDREQKQIS